jgi:hypothetical protein
MRLLYVMCVLAQRSQGVCVPSRGHVCGFFLGGTKPRLVQQMQAGMREEGRSRYIESLRNR